jgi:hypothetical protein
MPKPKGWKTLATDLPPLKAYEVSLALIETTGSVRKGLASLLEAERLKSREPFINKHLSSFVTYAMNGNAKGLEALLQEMPKNERDSRFIKDVIIPNTLHNDFLRKQLDEVRRWQNEEGMEMFRKAQAADAAMAENRELRRKLARYEEPRLSESGNP